MAVGCWLPVRFHHTADCGNDSDEMMGGIIIIGSSGER